MDDKVILLDDNYDNDDSSERLDDTATNTNTTNTPSNSTLRNSSSVSDENTIDLTLSPPSSPNLFRQSTSISSNNSRNNSRGLVLSNSNSIIDNSIIDNSIIDNSIIDNSIIDNSIIVSNNNDNSSTTQNNSISDNSGNKLKKQKICNNSSISENQILELDDENINGETQNLDNPISGTDEDKRTNFLCNICLDNMMLGSITSTICGHCFCLKCIEEYIKVNRKCPTCKKRVFKSQIHPMFISLDKF